MGFINQVSSRFWGITLNERERHGESGGFDGAEVGSQHLGAAKAFRFVFGVGSWINGQ